MSDETKTVCIWACPKCGLPAASNSVPCSRPQCLPAPSPPGDVDEDAADALVEESCAQERAARGRRRDRLAAAPPAPARDEVEAQRRAVELAFAAGRASRDEEVAGLREFADTETRDAIQLRAERDAARAWARRWKALAKDRDRSVDWHIQANRDVISSLVASENAARAEVERLRKAKDGAYAERNQCVAFITKTAQAMRWPTWLGRHDEADTTWENDWRNIVFVETPNGQLSWHIHDSEFPLFEHLPPKPGRQWDGHTTAEKYARMREFDAIAAARALVGAKERA